MTRINSTVINLTLVSMRRSSSSYNSLIVVYLVILYHCFRETKDDKIDDKSQKTILY